MKEEKILSSIIDLLAMSVEMVEELGDVETKMSVYRAFNAVYDRYEKKYGVE